MAYARINLDGNEDVWDFSVFVEELSSSGLYRSIRLCVEVGTTDYNFGRNGSYDVSCVEAEYSRSWNGAVPGSAQSKTILIDEIFDVYVEPGRTTVSIDFKATVSFSSQAAGGSVKAIASINLIEGLTMQADSLISSAKDIYFGDNCAITWTPASETFVYVLDFSMGNYRFTTEPISPLTTDSYTYSGLIIPEEEAVNIPNTDSAIVAVSLTQYSSYPDTTVGSPSQKTFKITLKDNVIPSITYRYAFKDNSSNDVVKDWDIALAGYTKVRIEATASGTCGSTIKSFTISGAYNKTVEGSSLSYTGGVIAQSGVKLFTVTCTDSRGRVSSGWTTNSIAFLPYTPPRVNKISVRKSDGQTNSNLIATASWTFDSVDGNNSATAKIYYKTSTASDWTEHHGALKSDEDFTLNLPSMDGRTSYNFKLIVTDQLGKSASKETFLSTTKVLMDFQAGGMGLGIGKLCEIDNIENGTQSLEISMDSYFFGDVFIGNAQQSLETYIRNITMYLKSGEDFGDKNPNEIEWDVTPQVGQIYYMKIPG